MTDTVDKLAEALHAVITRTDVRGCSGTHLMGYGVCQVFAADLIAHLPEGLVITTVEGLCRAVKRHASAQHGLLWTTCPCGESIAAAIRKADRCSCGPYAPCPEHDR